ncbi:MAG: hypothetical protein KDA91_15095 [Planctomycetaceae bacterium]|nr:hypothetical protein [Planctomycetaceae bacterium]
MTEAEKVAMPAWTKIVNGLLLVWNLFGLAVFVMAMTVFSSREAMSEAGLNEEQINLTLSTPGWVNIAFGVAVVFGVLGCLALIWKSRLAPPLLAVSMLGVIAQNVYMYLLSDTIRIMGVGVSPVVIAVAVALVPYAVFCKSRGWLK